MKIGFVLLLSGLLVGCGLMPESASQPETYYVDAENGSDSASGLSDQDAWQTLSQVNSANIAHGSTVLFQRGQIFRGQLLPHSGTAARPTRYGSYGSGTLPELRGSVDLMSSARWSEETAGIWVYSESFTTDVGNLIMNNATEFGQKKWANNELQVDGDYWYEKETGLLRMRSATNPATAYTHLEAALRKHVVDMQGASYVIFEELRLRYGAAHGFGGGNTEGITIRDCEIAYIGGGDLDMDGTNVRFGNGIEFWANARDHLVERNTIYEIYDTALSNQNHTQAVTQQNITYRDNTIWNTGMASFEYWNRPEHSTTSGIIFEHNTAAGAGEGWGAPPQRPDLQGVHLMLSFSPAQLSDLTIRDNVFYGGNLAIWIAYAHQWETGLLLDYNCYFKSEDDLITVNGAYDYDDDITTTSTTYAVDQLGEWQLYSSTDSNSIEADPMFVNAANNDYSLQPASPCRDQSSTGTDMGARL